MLVLYKRWKKHNEIKLIKNKMDLYNRKWKIIHPPPTNYRVTVQAPSPSEESHAVTIPWGKAVEEREDVTTLSKYNNNKHNLLVFYNSINKKTKWTSIIEKWQIIPPPEPATNKASQPVDPIAW